MILRHRGLFSNIAAVGIFFSGFFSHHAPSRIFQSDSVATNDGLLQVGEELQYSVSYSIFGLGKIRFRIADKFQRKGRTIYKVYSFIDSNPSLPFVNLHIIFESEIDQEVFSYHWLSRDSTKKYIAYRNFEFDYQHKHVIIEEGKQPHGSSRVTENIDTVAIPDRCQDGLSVFFYARKNVRQKKQDSIPTFIEKKQATTFINFMNKRTSQKIDAVDYPVDVVEFDGQADYTGVFGFSGDFRGWFSNDEARIPIVARLKVILGSVYIELEKWNRGGWQPPKHVKDKQE